MKNKKLFLSLILLLGTLTSCSKPTNKPTSSSSIDNESSQNNVEDIEEVEGNLLSNGTFSKLYDRTSSTDYYGIGSWNFLGMNGGKGSFIINSNKELEVTSENSSNCEYGIQVNHKSITLVKDSRYKVSFEMRAQTPQKGNCLVQQDYSPYKSYGEKKIDITTEMQKFEYEFVASATDENVSFCFNLGKYDDSTPKSNIFYIDNVSLVCISGQGTIEEEKQNILVNQLGFFENSKKEATIRGENIPSAYQIKTFDTNEVVYEGNIGEPRKNKSSNEMCSIIDFSNFKQIGKYYISCGDYGESYPFEIKDGVYDELLYSSIDFLYTQRCGCEVIDEVVGHEPCHSEKAKVYGTNQMIDVTGGWHDAGDYGKYIVAGVKTVEDLLIAYELYGDVFKYREEIEELGNDIPDILDEAIYELDFMLKMQADNGEVYHKVTTKSFPSLELKPQNDKEGLIVSPSSYAATGDFVATMAHASRILSSIDVERASKYKNAAIKAYEALLKMNKKSFKNPNDIVTGEYPDENLDDEFLWANIEMYRLLNQTSYLQSFENSLESASIDSVGFGWDNMSGYALYSYLKVDNSLLSKDIYVKDKLSTQYNVYKNNMDSDCYYSNVGELYEWGSNLKVCSGAELNILMNDLNLKVDNNYLQKYLDYILGKNTTSYCFVTGFGSNSPKNPHHRPSVASKVPVPGMLVGGPNNDFDNNGGDSVATSKLEGKASPAGSYIDHFNSWSTNEVTIYWNSPLTLLILGVNSNNLE